MVIIPSLVVGYNLGVNSALGFTESFSANYYCKVCNTHKKTASKMTSLGNDINYLNFDFYNNCIENNRFLTDSSVKENSVWNKLTNFHVTSNYAVDIMHDLLEGICH